MSDQVELIPGEASSEKADSSDKLDEGSNEQAEAVWRDWNFWVATYPGLETTLFLAPDNLPSDELTDFSSVDCSAELTFYDCDGGVSSEVSLAFPGSRVTTVELAQFMASVKLHCGWKAAHLRVRTSSAIRPYCRLQASSKAAFLGEPETVSDGQSAFFPVTISSDRRTVLAILNPARPEADGTATAKCRFYKGGRTPDAVVEIPAGGFRMLGIESEFAEYCDSEEGSQETFRGADQSYLRLSCRDGQILQAQVLEMIELDDKTRILSSVG